MRRFHVQRDASTPSSDVAVLKIGDNLLTGEQDFASMYGSLTSIEIDLLVIASSIFAADRACGRGEREQFTRFIEISIPVFNLGQLYPAIPTLEKLLRRLSNDAWRVRLRQESGGPSVQIPAIKQDGKTLLFSGGLDSFAAALEFGKAPNSLVLASHITRNRHTDSAQKALFTVLQNRGYRLEHKQCFVSSRTGGPTDLQHDEENTQRTRSFVFLVLAALIAIRSGHDELIYIAENGQLAIHLPLTHGRVGAFSTHTAHPDVLAATQAFLIQALNRGFTISNPYVHKTKSEVVQIIHGIAPEGLPIANSCWRNARLPAGNTHCGECIPCFVRRIAIEHITSDKTLYNRNPWIEKVAALPPDDDARRNIADLTELVRRFRYYTDDDIMSEWPELYSSHIDAANVIAMYRRFSNEAHTVLQRYNDLKPFLK